MLNTTADPNALIMRSFLFPNLQPGAPVNAKAVGKRLNDHVREPVRFDGRTLVLNSMMDKHARAYRYCVTVISDDAGA
jgi:hypothetical protein